MAKKITIELDLNRLGVIDPHFYVHEKELMVHDIINYSPDRIVYIASLEGKDIKKSSLTRLSKKEELLNLYNLESFEILSIGRRSDQYTILISQRVPPVLKKLIKRYYETIFLVPPINISQRSMKFNFLVVKHETKKFLELLKELDVPYTIRKTSGVFSAGGPLAPFPAKSCELTKKQATVLKKANDLGYFDIPRKLTMKQFSIELGISPASTHRILKRIERKAIIKLLENL
ncbi:MAG: helix-turn-helix domain-containing protein [Candidatus Thermoplasmatota archaeon]|nr:helix-turn-helix domain-containing protein [Candidatus Thermoplasmatota archaeon]MCL5988703.1 helix-turn-helix domain-containing protein [Candidatus Thermoplasmatota archaeon]